MIFKAAKPRISIRLNLMCEKMAENCVEIFFSIFTGLSESQQFNIQIRKTSGLEVLSFLYFV